MKYFRKVLFLFLCFFPSVYLHCGEDDIYFDDDDFLNELLEESGIDFDKELEKTAALKAGAPSADLLSIAFWPK